MRSTLKFKSIADVLEVETDSRLVNLLASISCLIAVADVSTDIEVSKVIDTIASFKVAKKHLAISIGDLDDALLQNKTINFNVAIHHKGAGSNLETVYIQSHTRLHLTTYRWEVFHHLFMSTFGKGAREGHHKSVPAPFSDTIWERVEDFFHWNQTIHLHE